MRTSSTDGASTTALGLHPCTLPYMTTIDYASAAEAVREHLDLHNDEGAIVAVLLGGFEREVAMVIDDGRSHLEEIAPNLGWILDELANDDIAHVLLVVPRSSGDVTDLDRQLLMRVRSVVRYMNVVDLLVVGETTWVSLEQALAA
jgi:hypothetical protein